ncbi:MAG: TlpA family protein disulfide reductase [Actinomycetota bacterium]|nr:TlpA family protein disulfide reductase [Actinomycetota bacterium]
MSARTKLFLIALLPSVMVGAVGLAAWRDRSAAGGSSVEVSGVMPTLEGPSLTGGRVGPDLYRGKLVLVNFWASWCAPCREEQPGLQRLWEEYRGRGVQFIGVNFKDDSAAARAYLEEFGVTYPSVEDPTGIVAHRFGMLAPPTTILVDVGGDMRHHLLGAQAESRLRRYIEELLDETSG